MLSRVLSSAARHAPRRALFSSSPSSSTAVGSYGLEGKVIVVAGAGNPPEEELGIGASTSLHLARHGATVVSVSNVAVNCDTVTDLITGEGLKGVSHVADCTDHGEAAALHARVKEEFGRVDCVINAGIHSALPMGFDKMTEQAWETGIALNLDAHFNLVHAFLPTFVEQQSGNIIHYTTIASSVGLGIGRQRHAYAAGKAAAATLTKRLGVEYAPQGIRGNVIAIGYVSGPLVNRAVANAGADIAAVTAGRDAYVPRGTQGTPMEVAEVAAFLASDNSKLVNAAEIPCDGGTSSCTYGP
jgi:NAD(P)-dependent dehydrogenase (short-subunit alcohol dehydrogenase family)